MAETDLISRRAAIDEITEYRSGYATYMSVGELKRRIEQLPPAQPEPKWIPCNEKLPEGEYVLISKKPTKISGDKWCVTIAIRMADPRSRKVNWRDIGFDVIQDNEVLAWMPLPEVYKERREDERSDR